MDYLKLQASFTTSMAWRLATPAARGASVSLLMYAARSMLPGRIPASVDWDDQRWMAAADIDSEYVMQVVEAGLACWEGDDLVLGGFDHRGFEQLCVQRRQGPHGAKGGRPKTLTKTPRVIDRGNPKGSAPKTPSPVQSSPDQPKGSAPVGADAAAAATPDLDFEPSEIDRPVPVLVVRNARPAIGDLDHLRHAGAFIGREEGGAWQLLVDDRGLEAVRSAALAVKASGKIPYLSAVSAHLGISAQPDEYVVIDGEKIRVTKRK